MTNNSELQSLLVEIDKIIKKQKLIEDEAYKRGESYNIFEIFNLATYELAHSKFIANLLDVKGSHGLSVSPLTEFLKVCGLSECWNGWDIANSKVYTEYAIGNVTLDGDASGGRIDILVRSESGKQIIIENKIYAGDQALQLQRYKNYASQSSDLLIYLTLDGHEASMDSSGDLKPGDDYYPIGYGNEINEWIENCIISSISKPLIRETLIQYQNALKKLTYKTMDKKVEMDIYKIIKEHPESVTTIVQHLDGYIRYMVNSEILPGLTRMAEKHGFIFSSNGMESGRNYQGFGFCKKNADWTNTIRFEFEVKGYRSLIIGVHCPIDQVPETKIPYFNGTPNKNWIYGFKDLDPVWDAVVVSDPAKLVSRIENELMRLYQYVIDNQIRM